MGKIYNLFLPKKEAFASGELSLARGLRNTRQLVAAPEGKIEFRWNKLFKMVNGLGGLEDGFFSPCRSCQKTEMKAKESSAFYLS